MVSYEINYISHIHIFMYIIFVMFQSSFTENNDVNVYNILLSSCLIVAFSRIELDGYILRWYKQKQLVIAAVNAHTKLSDRNTNQKMTPEPLQQ